MIIKKKSLTLIPLLLLTVWYSIIFWDPVSLTVGDPPELMSIYGLLMVLLIISIAGKIISWKYTDHFTALYLTAWAILQWQAHWEAFFLGASSTKIDGYNSYFSETYRFSEASVDQLIPDLYHTVLGVLIVITLIVTFYNVFKIIIGNLRKR